MDMKPTRYSSLLALTLSGVLIVTLKSHALVQYWQQSRHILLDVAPPPAISELVSRYLFDDEQWPDFSAPFSAIEQQLFALSQAPWPTDVAAAEGNAADIQSESLNLANLTAPSTDITPASNGQTVPIAMAQNAATPNAIAQNATTQNAKAASATTNKTTTQTPTTSVLPSPATTEVGATSVNAAASDATARLIAQTNGTTPEVPSAEAVALKQPSNATLNSLDAMGNIELEPQDRVLLIGDSLMQGLAPHLVARFKKKDQIQTIDMSRHSTGLTYPAFYNWPNAVKQAFAEQAFDVMIVFMGANDPWDMTIKGKYIRFASPRWNEIYTERVRAILEVASANNTRVIWLSTPPMGREDIKAKIPQLNQLYKTEIEKFAATARFIDTAPVLTTDGVSFSRFIELPERGSVMLRTDDGIHFTTQGHRLLSKLTLAQFQLPQPKKRPE
jgi:hypothetical protein